MVGWRPNLAVLVQRPTMKPIGLHLLENGDVLTTHCIRKPSEAIVVFCHVYIMQNKMIQHTLFNQIQAKESWLIHFLYLRWSFSFHYNQIEDAPSYHPSILHRILPQPIIILYDVTAGRYR